MSQVYTQYEHLGQWGADGISDSSSCNQQPMPMSKLLKFYMTEDICNPLRTVSNEDLSVISTDFMNVYLLLAYLHQISGNLAMHI
jgi:hypothetical protein